MNNDKVVNTRISKKLYEKIATKAKKNRITVSNLIRNVVEDALEINEDIHDAIDKRVRKYLSESMKKNILGFQEIALAKETLCDNCDKQLNAGEVAYFAFFEDSNEKAVICASCKNETRTNK